MTILSINEDRGRQRLGTAAKLQTSIATVQDQGVVATIIQQSDGSYIRSNICTQAVISSTLPLPNKLRHRGAALYSRRRYTHMSTSRCHEP